MLHTHAEHFDKIRKEIHLDAQSKARELLKRILTSHCTLLRLTLNSNQKDRLPYYLSSRPYFSEASAIDERAAARSETLAHRQPAQFNYTG